MTPPDALLVLIQLAFWLTAGLTLLDFLRYRTPDLLDVVLALASVALIVTVLMVPLGLLPTWVSVGAALGASAEPMLLLRLVRHTRPVSQLVYWLALGGMLIVWVIVIALPTPRPAWSVVLGGAYFVAINGYVAWALVQAARMARGYGRQRAYLAAAGTLALGMLLLLAPVSMILRLQGLDQILVPFGLLLLLFILFAFYLGFASPHWLRRVWQEGELYRFVQDLVQHVGDQQPDAVLDLLRESALRSVGACAVQIALWDQEGKHLVLKDSTAIQEGDAELEAETGIIARAWETMQPELARTRVGMGGDEVRRAQQFGATALITVPLLMTRATPGVLLAWFYNAPLFPRDDCELLALFAEQTVLAIDHAMLHQGLSLQSEIARNMAEGVVLIRARDATIVYANPKFEELFGFAPGELIGKPLGLTLASDGELPEQIVRGTSEGIRQHGTWSGEIHNRRQNGTLFWSMANISSLEHPELGQVWVAVHTDITDRTLAQEQTRREAARAAALVNIASRLNFEINLSKVLELVCQETARLMDVPLVIIYLYEPQTRTLQAESAYGLPQDALEFAPSLEPTIFQDSPFRRGSLVVVPDVQALGEIPGLAVLQMLDVRSTVNAPMIHKGGLVGYLILASQGTARAFTADELDLLDGITHQATLAVGNAQLFAEHERAEQEIKELNTDLERRVIERTAELERINRELQNQVHHRQQVERELGAAYEKLKRHVSDLQDRNRDITLVNQMGETLEACSSIEDAYQVVSKFAPRLFVGTAGALGLLSASRNLVEWVVQWGETRTEISHPIFVPEDCWALRRARPHAVQDSTTELLCKHLNDPPPRTYLCIPLAAQGEILGLLHLARGEPQPFTDGDEQLAFNVARHVEQALANLKLRESLKQQSIRDPLTGLYNRRYMEESLAREVRRAARNQQPLGVIMLDLDHFKQFNDTLGHDAGDALLREFGGYLLSHVRFEDIACRFGGEEFALILPEAQLGVVAERAEQIRMGTRLLSIHYRGQRLPSVTVSLGVAMFPQDGANGGDVLRAADSALYRAKAAGRDRVVLAADEQSSGEVRFRPDAEWN